MAELYSSAADYWDPALIRSQLRAVDNKPFSPSAEVNYYRAFYQLKFDAVPDVQYSMALVASNSGQLVSQCWQLPQAERTVLLVHGYYDHVGLYRHLINALLLAGFNVVAFDLPGHGLSEGLPLVIDDFGNYGQAVAAVKIAYQQRLNLPWSLVGQSTGGSALLDAVLSKQVRADHLVLMAPLLRTRRWASVCLSYWLGHWFLEHVPRRFKSSSHDPEFLSFIEHQDPLQERHTPVAWVAAMIRWQANFKGLPQSDIPCCYISGTEDDTVDFEYNYSQIAPHFRDISLFEINHAQHHLVNEREDLRDRGFAEVVRFLRDAA